MVGRMGTDILQRFRDGLASKAFTLAEVSEATGIPIPRLSEMKQEDWGTKALGRLEALSDGLEKIEAGRKAGRKSREAKEARA